MDVSETVWPPEDTVEASTRRRFLAALAASGVALGTVSAAPAAAHAAEPGGAGDPNAPVADPSAPVVDRPDAFPAPTAGTTYRTFMGSAFLPLLDTYTYSKGFGDVRSTGIFYRSLADLPVGSRLTEVSYAVIKSGLFTGNVSGFLYRLTSGALGPALASANTNAFGDTDAEQYINLTVPANTEVTADNELWLVVNLEDNIVNSVRVGYIPPAVQPAFYPIAPKRAYDSRFVAPTGTLGSGGSRTISVADGYPDGSPAVDLPGVVPVGATAVAYNLTITETAGAGFLSVNPGGALTSAGSSINWGAPNVSIANGLVGTLGGDRQFTVFCGGTPDARAHFIIDVLGYYR